MCRQLCVDPERGGAVRGLRNCLNKKSRCVLTQRRNSSESVSHIAQISARCTTHRQQRINLLLSKLCISSSRKWSPSSAPSLEFPDNVAKGGDLRVMRG
jgi:hypothetical protein